MVAKYGRAEVHNVSFKVNVLDKNTKDFEVDDTDAIYGETFKAMCIGVGFTHIFAWKCSICLLSQVDTTISARGSFNCHT